MYAKKMVKPSRTDLKINTSYVGETIEQKIRRILNNKEPITDGAPLIFQERKDGVQPQYNIRTDRWELAVEAMDYVDKSHIAKREERLKPKEEPKTGEGKDGGTESTQATDPK